MSDLADATPPRILVVDDSPANLLSLEVTLDGLGATIDKAASGEEALRILREDDFAAVLLDVQLPILSGFETAVRIREHEGSKSTPILFITAYDDDPRFPIRKAYSLGAVDYLVKPLIPEILRSKVAVFIELFRKTKAANRGEMAAHERLATALASVSDLFLTMDRELRYTYVNDRVVQASGIPRERILGRCLQDVFPETTGTLFERELKRTIDEHTPVHFEYHNATKDRWFENRAYPSPDGLMLVATDITDRKKSEELRRRLAAIVEGSNDIIVSAALDGIITTWNGGAERALGYTAEEIIGKHISEIMPPEYVEDMQTILRRIAQGDTNHYETKRRRKDGTVIDVSLTTSPIRDAHGRVVGASKVGRDITARKIIEAERQEADRRKDEFLAMLAHELRNPVASINGAVELLGRLRTEEDLLWAKDVVQRQVKHLARLIDDLLDVSRITRGKIGLRKELLDLSPVVSSAVEVVRPLIEERKHKLTLALAAGALQLEADPLRLEQVLVNLLINAAKYTDAGGHISLSAGCEETQIIITVRDTGIGMSPDLLARAFDLFAQGDRSIARSEGGLGIGLTLVQKLAELHGGSVTASSDGVGKGSEFTVRLPAWDGAPSQKPRAEDALPRLARPNSRVLVVDDNADTVRGLAKLLTLLGHDVKTAHDGQTAIELANAHKPEIVLLDIGLPGVNGYEVAKRLRVEASCKEALIIAVSGYGQEEDRRRSREAGFDHHLVKPLDYDVLMSLFAIPS